MRYLQLTLVLFTWLAITPWMQVAEAHPRVSIGIGIGPGFYGPGPWYPYRYGYGYPYAYPYGYPYYGPGPVVIQQAPIVIGAAPVAPAPAVVVGSTPVPTQQPPLGSEALPEPIVRAVPPTQPTVVPVRNETPTRMDTLLNQLSDPSETVRRDAALDLGRMKAQRAVDPLLSLLAKDASPLARDGAARGLGLIGSPRSLNGLIYAAQADNDRDVRHSAQFAVEVIRTNLRGN